MINTRDRENVKMLKLDRARRIYMQEVQASKDMISVHEAACFQFVVDSEVTMRVYQSMYSARAHTTTEN